MPGGAGKVSAGDCGGRGYQHVGARRRDLSAGDLGDGNSANFKRGAAASGFEHIVVCNGIGLQEQGAVGGTGVNSTAVDERGIDFAISADGFAVRECDTGISGDLRVWTIIGECYGSGAKQDGIGGKVQIRASTILI